MPQAFFDRARRLADLQAEIPQQIKEVFDDLLGMWGPLVGQQKQEIDVRIGRQLSAPVPAHRDDRQTLARGRVGERVDLFGDQVEQHADQLVHQETLLAHHRGAIRRRLEAPADLGAAFDQRRLCRRDKGSAVERRHVRTEAAAADSSAASARRSMMSRCRAMLAILRLLYRPVGDGTGGVLQMGNARHHRESRCCPFPPFGAEEVRGSGTARMWISTAHVRRCRRPPRRRAAAGAGAACPGIGCRFSGGAMASPRRRYRGSCRPPRRAAGSSAKPRCCATHLPPHGGSICPPVSGARSA